MSSPFNVIVIILAVLVAGVMIGNYSVRAIRAPAYKAEPMTRMEGILISNDGREAQPWK